MAYDVAAWLRGRVGEIHLCERARTMANRHPLDATHAMSAVATFSTATASSTRSSSVLEDRQQTSRPSARAAAPCPETSRGRRSTSLHRSAAWCVVVVVHTVSKCATTRRAVATRP